MGFGEDVALAGHVGDDDGLSVSDEGGVDVFVGAGEFLDCVDMESAFVGECGCAYVGGADVGLEVSDFVYEEGEFAEAGEIGDAVDLELELECGDEGGEVAIADALTVAVDGSLDLGSAGLDCCDGIGYAEAGVVVGVDADGDGEFGGDLCGGGADEIWEGAAVGIAEDEGVCAGVIGGLEGLDCVIGVFAEAIEEVFSVVEDGAAVLFEVSDGFVDHGEVFLGGDAENLCDVEEPGFADDGDDGGFSFEEHGDLGVFVYGDPAAAGATEGSELSLAEGDFAGFLEEGGVAGVRAGPTAFDKVDTEVV